MTNLFGALMYVYFFFSSRRRHTRFDCDWSSDVCSCDLAAVDRHPALLLVEHDRADAQAALDHAAVRAAQHGADAAAQLRKAERSEERRVGKECRSRWPTYHSKKK